MTYATRAQLADRYGEGMLINLTDRGDIATGEASEAVITRALADAAALIDAHLAGRYALPLAEVPSVLTDIALSVAIWKLHRHEPDAKIVKDHDQALRLLRDIAAGTVRLQVAGIETPGTGGSGARITDRDRPFTEANLKGFI